MLIFAGLAVGWMAMAWLPLLGAVELKWEMNRESGRWSFTGPSLALESAVTRVGVNGAWIELGRGEVSPTVLVRDALGEGERSVVRSNARGVEFSLSVTRYREGARAVVEATMRNVSAQPQIVTKFRAFQGRTLTRGLAAACRFLKNSGTQGTSGAVPIGIRPK